MPEDPPAERPGRLHRSGAWAGLRTGDPVEVVDAGIRGARWTFVAHVVNTATGEQWVEVVGGREGERTVRSFAPERIFPVSSTKRPAARPPSYVDAPQLPFD